MCLHKCFENMTLKTADPWYNFEMGNEPSVVYCNGSRNHGCHGCHCRFPDYNPSRGHCIKCGKMFFELLDLLWTIRQQVYRCFFKDLGCLPLFDMEYEIEWRIHESVTRDLLGCSRSELLDIYRDVATAITQNVIDRKMKQLLPVCV